MTPEQHALLSVKRYGGKQEDYYNVHYLMDYSKHFITNGNAVHRAFSHNWWGISLLESIIPLKIINGVSIRQLLIDHVREDCGKVPTLEDCARALAAGEYLRLYNKPNQRDIKWLKEQELKM